ncbi:AAA family ATPase [Spartinivicinus poritis]|uniref:MoxR family ATPase n=1 Tax=Spartinivicinus poritis TaxID=2994640 RepID=A0ABT5U505_9GAMM|nr:MoxR family ATPase [Spartinivicinus sp. A2-2]MDE1461441.1 MoxR family ATPase [Spartinivicinus sp. A2-2]
MTQTPNATLEQTKAYELTQQIQQQLNKVVIGQPEVINQVLIGLLAGGHILIEGVPGLGKTLLVRSLAKTFNGHFSRIQFTPDLMPTDITGHALFNMQSREFEIRKGPVFTNLLLADEINRAPAKTQAALLEVMQEKQVTIEGDSFAVSAPFMVLATQNPIEQEGTYPLPEAELDRFMMKVFINYPAADQELAMVTQLSAPSKEDYLAQVKPILSAQAVINLQQMTNQVTTDTSVLDYAVRIVRTTRDWPGIARGAGPRASLFIVQAAKANALLNGRNFITPDDIKTLALPILRHRVLLSADRELEGVTADQALQELLVQVDAPRQ